MENILPEENILAQTNAFQELKRISDQIYVFLVIKVNLAVFMMPMNVYRALLDITINFKVLHIVLNVLMDIILLRSVLHTVKCALLENSHRIQE